MLLNPLCFFGRIQSLSSYFNGLQDGGQSAWDDRYREHGSDTGIHPFGEPDYQDRRSANSVQFTHILWLVFQIVFDEARLRA